MEFDFALCGLLGRRDCPCQELKQACANCLCTQYFFERVGGGGCGVCGELYFSFGDTEVVFTYGFSR